MTPRYGLPLAAGVWTLVLVLAGFTWVIVTRRGPSGEARRRGNIRVGLFAGIMGGALGLSAMSRVSYDDLARPFWIYLAYWGLGLFLPLIIGIWLLSRWAKQTRPKEWDAIKDGTATWGEFSPKMKRAYVLLAVLVILPAALIQFAFYGN